MSILLASTCPNEAQVEERRADRRASMKAQLARGNCFLCVCFRGSQSVVGLVAGKLRSKLGSLSCSFGRHGRGGGVQCCSTCAMATFALRNSPGPFERRPTYGVTPPEHIPSLRRREGGLRKDPACASLQFPVRGKRFSSPTTSYEGALW